VRLQRTGNRGRTATQNDRDFPAKIETSQVVVVTLGNDQPIADKHHRRRYLLRRFDAHAENRIFPQRQRLPLAVSHQRQARLPFHDLSGAKLHRLYIAGFAGRFQTAAFKLGRDILGRPPMSWTTGFAAFELVVSEKRDVRPPAFAVVCFHSRPV